MKKHRGFPTVLKSLAALFLIVYAAKVEAATLDLDGAVREAMGDSPVLKHSGAAVDESSWAKVEAISGFLPKVSLSANHYFDNTFQYLTLGGPAQTTFSLIYPYSTFSIDASLTLFDGFETYYRVKAAGLNTRASELNYSYEKLKVEEDVKLKFYQALAAQALLAVTDQNLKTLEDHLSKVQSQTRVGTATKFDLLRVEVQMNDAKSDKLAAQDAVALSLMKLAQAMGKESEDRNLVGELPVPTANKLNLPVAQSSVRPDIQASKLRAEAAENKKIGSRGFWYPRVSLISQYLLYDNVDRNWDNSAQTYHNTYFIGASLSCNIFDGAASLARSKEAVYQATAAQASTRITELQAPIDLELWKRRYALNTQIYLAKKSDVEKAEESVRLATLGIRAGTRTSTEVLDAELDLFRARAGVVRAQVDAAEAKINFELAVGQRI
jgi:outer membrane protein TolC